MIPLYSRKLSVVRFNMRKVKYFGSIKSDCSIQEFDRSIPIVPRVGSISAYYYSLYTELCYILGCLLGICGRNSKISLKYLFSFVCLMEYVNLWHLYFYIKNLTFPGYSPVPVHYLFLVKDLNVIHLGLYLRVPPYCLCNI